MFDAVATMNIKKGAVWWLQSRDRDGKPEMALRAVTTPELL